MDQEKPDRRVQRTRQLIRDAMIALIAEKGYEKITIQDILDRANIGRSTFYAHYRDKEDLLLRGVAEIAYGEEMEEAVQEDLHRLEAHGMSGTIFTTPMFTHIQQNQMLHKAIVGKLGGDPIVEKGAAFLYANTKAQLETLLEDGQEPSVPLPVLAQFLTGGLMSLIRWWLETDRRYTPQQMDDLFQKMAMPGVREVLGL
ncbi:MAG TPA: TetR/AcrR family transcriptional regulator [Anaerolineales bacterium]|nr:TetR/AcrR family transcriptional regulator [Anaerolineales bacterium]